MDIVKASEISKVMYGNIPIDAIYRGSEKIYPIALCDRAVSIWFKGTDNEATGVFNPNAPYWVDLVNGVQAELVGVDWIDGGLRFNGNSSIVKYAPNRTGNLPEYTLSAVVMIEKIGDYPRIAAEQQFPTLYANLMNMFWRYYGQGTDNQFVPNIAVQTGVKIVPCIRKKANERKVDFFINGVYLASINLVSATAEAKWEPLQSLGNRISPSNRGLTGEYNDMRFHEAALTDEEIFNNYLYDKIEYKL